MKIWLRPLPFALLGAYAAAKIDRAPVDDAAASRSAALCAALTETVACVPEDVVWVDPPRGAVGSALGGEGRVVVRGHARKSEDDPPSFDLFLATARLSPEGRLLDVGDVHPLTATSADEGLPVVRGSLLAYLVSVDGRPEAVHVLDLAGHARSSFDELSRFQRFQVSVADLQTTGQSRGYRKTVYAFSPPVKSASLAWTDPSTLAITTDARPIVVDASTESVTIGSGFVRVTPETVSKPPTFAPWMSDRLRAVSWFGDDKNQMLKAIAFTAIEWLKGTRSRITGDTGEKDAQDDLGTGHVTSTTFADPDTGWPPKPLEPLLKPPLAGEGQWISLEKDPFITPMPGIAMPFVTTYVRGDPGAPQTRVYITLWDPRVVALHMEAGTVEPVSATGETGPGCIPRTPEVYRRVVAGFNGGFQATHGEFGMQANGVLYLPPKPYAATVMELRDGTTAFGAWPTTSQVPDDVLSFRQNLSPLVQSDKYNPWQRAWWGGVPPGWHDAIHTTRSGICLTKEGWVAYFYGSDIGPEPLGRAMLVARCAFGIHLDMNPGLAGFEFYNVQPATNWQPLGRPLQADWEYEGTVKDLESFKFRARRMIKSMGHMLFPRYVHKDGRDFFYLTSRAVLPGAQVAGQEDPWRVKGLPQHGYPYAIALGNVTEGGRKLRVVRVDPRTVRAEPDETKTEGDVVVLFGRAARRAGKRDAGAEPTTDAKHLFLGPHVFAIEKSVPSVGGAVALATLLAPGAPGSELARAAAGITDEDGMLTWVELPPDAQPDAASGDAMMKLLERLGCSSRGLVGEGMRAFPGASLDAAGAPSAVPPAGIRLFRALAPGARAIFESTPIVGPSVWQPAQQQHVKWRPTLAPPDKPTASSTPSGTPSATP
ncbi:MAG TPA: hypothetical protein VIF62_06030 [Labilithrix sp.]